MSLRDIIAKVKAHPELWQSGHPYYRQRVVSARTWKQIAAELRADDWITVKKRWKHMKDTFRKEVKKVTTNQIPMSGWIHYSEMEFLLEEIAKPQPVQESDRSDTEIDVKKTKLKRVHRKKRLDLAARLETRSQSSLKFRKILRSLNTLCKHLGRSTNIVDDDLKNDTDYMFLVSLLPTMQHLSDVQRLHFRGKINNWLLNALMENEFAAVCDAKASMQEQNDANMTD